MTRERLQDILEKHFGKFIENESVTKSRMLLLSSFTQYVVMHGTMAHLFKRRTVRDLKIIERVECEWTKHNFLNRLRDELLREYNQYMNPEWFLEHDIENFKRNIQ